MLQKWMHFFYLVDFSFNASFRKMWVALKRAFGTVVYNRFCLLCFLCLGFLGCWFLRCLWLLCCFWFLCLLWWTSWLFFAAFLAFFGDLALVFFTFFGDFFAFLAFFAVFALDFLAFFAFFGDFFAFLAFLAFFAFFGLATLPTLNLPLAPVAVEPLGRTSAPDFRTFGEGGLHVVGKSAVVAGRVVGNDVLTDGHRWGPFPVFHGFDGSADIIQHGWFRGSTLGLGPSSSSLETLPSLLWSSSCSLGIHSYCDYDSWTWT